jgi:hypothetical protein
MSNYFNVSACVHIAGASHRPALTINGKTWVKPQDCASHKEASDVAKAMVDELADVALAQVRVDGWAPDA